MIQLITIITAVLAGAYFGITYAAHRIKKDGLWSWRGEWFMPAVNAWRGPEESPVKSGMILWYDWADQPHFLRFKMTNAGWRLFEQIKRQHSITRWAYISDLEKLPGYKKVLDADS